MKEEALSVKVPTGLYLDVATRLRLSAVSDTRTQPAPQFTCARINLRW